MKLKSKTCPVCGETLGVCASNFPITVVKRVRSGARRAKYSLCRKCTRIADVRRNKQRSEQLKSYDKKYKKSNMESLAKKASDHYANNVRWNRYGVEREKIEEIHTGYCAICGVKEGDLKRRLHIDHDHTTGTVRGMLCGSCNLGLGHFRDSKLILLNAVEYLGRDK